MKLIVSLLALFLCSCYQPWTESDKQNFMGGCMNGALKDMDGAKAKEYCSCMLEKVQKRYPNVSDMKYIKKDTAIYTMGQECRKLAQ